MEDNSELKTFIKIWLTAIASLCYCYFIPNHIPHGFRRLLSLLPVITVFFILPLPLSTVHLAGPTIFYLVWLGNFKLLLFAFNRGPLSSKPPLKLLNFISIALLPINPKHTGNKVNKVSNPDLDLNSVSSNNPILLTIKALILSVIVVVYQYRENLNRNVILDRDLDSVSLHKPILLAVKALILALIVVAYQYRDNLHPNVILGFYCCNVYLGVEFVLAITAFLVRFILRFNFEIEPQFNEPYLASSLQDFWGRRWNLMVTRILRPTVYDPVREVLSPVIGKTWSRLPAIVATFVVSGLMHELIYWYFTRVRPTWEVTWFFLVHGVCTAVEVAVKKVVDGRVRLHRVVSGVVTVAFVAVTGVWLFLPQILRNGVDVKAIDEYSVVVDFLKSKMG